MARIISGIAGIAIMITGTALAQLASDEVPHDRTLPIDEEVRLQLESSHRAGIFRLQPTFSVHDFGYDSNVYGLTANPIGDWHSTVAMGTRFVVPFSRKFYVRGSAIPEYTYYQKLTNRRFFGGNYGGSILGLFNHMTVQAAGSVFKGEGPVSSEVDRASLGTRSDARADIEVDVLGRLSVFADAEGQRQRYTTTSDEAMLGIAATPLERNETAARGGLRYRFASYLSFSAAAEKTKSTFLIDSTRDNRSNAVIAGVRYDRPRAFINISVGARKGEAPFLGSIFPKYTTTTGSYFASRELAAGIALAAYGHRGLGYSLTVENPYFIETINGGEVVVPMGNRFALRVFGEAGKNDYPLPVKSIKRVDDRTSYGGGVAIRLRRNMVMNAIASESRIKSTLSENNRSVFRVATSISFEPRPHLFR